MSLLDKASLIVTPNAYKESKLYSVVPNTTLGDMTVVRATTATRVNSAGLIEEVPRNLLTYSQDFTNASWSKSGVTITANTTVAPNGTTTASKLVEDGFLVTYGVYKGITTGFRYSHSIYAKKGERDWIKVNAIHGSNQSVWFNLANGTIGTNNTTGTPSIENVGNGWYRCVINNTNHSAASSFYSVMPCTNNNIETYTGTIGNGVFIWGAQLDKFATATEYFPTTTRLNIPRIDYTNGSCPSLLVEPQRTNLALNSDGNVSTYPTSVNVSNASSSFNSFVNAIQFPSTGLALAYKTVITTVQPYAVSAFIKMDDNSVPILSASATTGNLCLIIAGNIATNNLKVESYGNNVYRLSATATSAGINGNNGVLRYDTQVLKSFKITGIQLEAASYPTSYIPTVASSVTRNADVISKTGISSLIGQTEGTVFLDLFASAQNSDSVPGFSVLSDIGTGVNRIQIYTNNGFIGFIIYNPSALVVASAFNITPNTNIKVALGYSSGATFMFVNGTQVATTAAALSLSGLDAFTLNKVFDANLSAKNNYNEVVIWKTKLSNTELSQLTTL